MNFIALLQFQDPGVVVAGSLSHCDDFLVPVKRIEPVHIIKVALLYTETKSKCWLCVQAFF